jgi:hypothetical protein
MKNINIIITLILIIVFTSCSNKIISTKNIPYVQYLQYTKVKKFIHHDDVKAILNITYLNSADNKNWNNEKQNFLVGIYLPNKKITNFEIKMNNKFFIEKIAIDKENKLYKNIPLKNHWAKYFIFSFNDIKQKNIVIIYNYSTNQNLSIQFTKEL